MWSALVQFPINPKDWSFLPTTILAVAFLVGVFVWAAMKLGLAKKNGTNGHIPTPPELSGTKPPDYWIRTFDEIIERRIAPARTMLHDVIAEQTASKSRDNSLIRALERIEAKLEDVRLKQGKIE